MSQNVVGMVFEIPVLEKSSNWRFLWVFIQLGKSGPNLQDLTNRWNNWKGGTQSKLIFKVKGLWDESKKLNLVRFDSWASEITASKLLEYTIKPFSLCRLQILSAKFPFNLLLERFNKLNDVNIAKLGTDPAIWLLNKDKYSNESFRYPFKLWRDSRTFPFRWFIDKSKVVHISSIDFGMPPSSWLSSRWSSSREFMLPKAFEIEPFNWLEER